MSKDMTNSVGSIRPPILEPDTWHAPTMHESVDSFLSARKDNKKDRSLGYIAVFKRDISPVDLYCYLKGRFGSPNGYLMITKKQNDSDNLIHWHYHLNSGDKQIHFYGRTYHVEVICQHVEKISDDDWRIFPSILKSEFGKWGQNKSAALKELERWRIFVNPYQRILSVVKKLYKEFTELDDLFMPTHKEMQNYVKESKKNGNDKSEYRGLETTTYDHLQKGLSLKFLLPVLVESFVNILIFVLSRDEIRLSAQEYENLIREQILDRVKLLPIKCRGFKSGFDLSDQRYKDFQTLMNDRNDFLHGNVDPRKFGFADVYFDQYIPLFKEPGRSMFTHSNECATRYIEREQIERDFQVAMKFCDYVLEQIDRDIRSQITMLLTCSDPGWNVKTNRVGVLFPPHSAEMVIQMGDDYFLDEEH